MKEIWYLCWFEKGAKMEGYRCLSLCWNTLWHVWFNVGNIHSPVVHKVKKGDKTKRKSLMSEFSNMISEDFNFTLTYERLRFQIRFFLYSRALYIIPFVSYPGLVFHLMLPCWAAYTMREVDCIIETLLWFLTRLHYPISIPGISSQEHENTWVYERPTSEMEGDTMSELISH